MKISEKIMKINDLRRAVSASSFEPTQFANPKKTATHTASIRSLLPRRSAA
jgi:hypothetical protein